VIEKESMEKFHFSINSFSIKIKNGGKFSIFHHF